MTTYKVFISQPMAGRLEEDILEERAKIVDMLNNVGLGLGPMGVKVEIIDSFLLKEPDCKNKPLGYLAESLRLLGEADVAVFAPGWKDARGCRIEHTCAEEYGISVVSLNHLV